MKFKPFDPTEAASSNESQDPRLVAAMEYYLSELEAGRPPDRNQFLARFPEIAGELAGQLEGIDFLHGIAPHANLQGTSPKGDHEQARIPRRATLGDFRLIRQIGQGGMGVVYEAEQLSLGRRVAVKVLPFAAMLNDQHRKRFYNEARAAATLDHSNIVPVHFVGQERGVHFFAMQLINGQSLAELIEDLRKTAPHTLNHQPEKAPIPQPLSPKRGEESLDETLRNATVCVDTKAQRKGDDTQSNFLSTISSVHSGDRGAFCRTAARLGAEAAEAIDHAHQQGILHRDIKPGNLLVDGSGKLWVADFGLATIEHGETLTRTGGVVGTAAYMSPEQAAASPNIDGRSDVYGLGATLYELLTMRRHRGEQSTGEAKISKSFVDIESLRSLDPAIPVDLETIVLKALAVDPADRYQTADAMADDLRSFVAGKEIRARRLTFTQRQTRRLQRHQRLAVAVLAVSFLGMLLVAAAATAYSNQLAHVLKEKEVALAAAQESRQRAELSESMAQQSALAAKASETFARRLSYRSDMQLAFEKYADGDLMQTTEILARQIPDETEVDIRAVEWHVLNAEVNAKYTPLGAHTGQATECVLYPDGKTVATAGEDGLIHVWDIAARRKIKTLEARIGEIHSMAISPDGKTLAVGGNPSIMTLAYALIHMIDTETGKRPRTCQSHLTTIESIEFSPDGKLIAAGSRYEQVKVSTVAGKHLHTIDNSNRNQSISFSPDSKYLAACSSAQTFQIWDCESGEPRFEQPIETGSAIKMVKWSPDGGFLAVTWEGLPVLSFYDVDSGARVAEASIDREQSRNHSALFLGHDSRISTGDSRGWVRQWDSNIGRWRNHLATKGSPFQQRQEFDTVNSSNEEVTSIVRLPSKSVVTTHLDGSVKSLNRHETAARIYRLDFSTVAAACVCESEIFLAGTDGLVRRLDLESGNVLQQIQIQAGVSVSDIAVSEEPTKLVVGYRTGRVDLLDVHRGELIAFWPGLPEKREIFVRVAVSANGEFVARTGVPPQPLMIWRCSEQQPIFRKPYASTGAAIQFSRDATMLAHRDVSLEIIDFGDGDRIDQYPLPWMESIQFSADGKTLAMGTADGQVQLLDIESKTRKESGSGPQDWRSVAIDTTNRTIVSTGRLDHGVRFTDVATGEDYGSVAHPTPENEVNAKDPYWAKNVFVFERRLIKWNADERRNQDGSMLAIWDW